MTSVGARLVSLVFAGALLASCGGAAAPVSSASPPAPASSSPAGVTKPASSAAPSSVKPSGSVGASASVAASGLIPIRAGYPQATITQGPSWVAIDEDFFKNNGWTPVSR
ncbi:MAG TPA: hypothetical protein VKU60_01550 [Chloroflexota bacterium]|nr:hypothetical protein [Chloroflexota bacterium]